MVSASTEGSITIFHPQVWGLISIIIVPLFALFLGGVVYWLRKLDERVYVLAQSMAHMEAKICGLLRIKENIK